MVSSFMMTGLELRVCKPHALGASLNRVKLEILSGFRFGTLERSGRSLTADALHGLGGLGFFDFLKIADAGWVEADALKQEAGKILRSSPVVDYWPVQIAMVLEFWARESGVELPLPERVGRGLARQASARDVTETS